MTTGDLKQDIIKVNNRVNQSLFGNGLRWQKVDILGDKIVIISENMRLKPLSALDDRDRMATRMVDIALIDEYKARLRQEIQEVLGVTVRSILKDYDPKHQVSGTIILTEERLGDQAGSYE
ncbi:MAG TPA: Na-translocating system protein MpsC family protein [Symbiobacteriaceae bacterium]|nr:Na-translocating system protein MpsC family protein [Symbiobacteriaceae bacterium]